jgi:hypothetical protein
MIDEHNRPDFPPVPPVPDNPKRFDKVEPGTKPDVKEPNLAVIALHRVKAILTKAAKGQGVLGQVIYAALDIVPGGGSISELIKATVKKTESTGIKSAINERIEKMKWLRFALTATMFVASIYGFIKGVVTIDDLLRILEALL